MSTYEDKRVWAETDAIDAIDWENADIGISGLAEHVYAAIERYLTIDERAGYTDFLERDLYKIAMERVAQGEPVSDEILDDLLCCYLRRDKSGHPEIIQIIEAKYQTYALLDTAVSNEPASDGECVL